MQHTGIAGQVVSGGAVTAQIANDQVVIGRQDRIGRAGVVRREAPLLGRFMTKLVLDVLPAALASVIGGFLFTQYQHSRTAAAQPTTEQVMPASPEMMRLVRDEHDAIINYLKSQTALEKTRASAPAVEDVDDVHAAADAKVQPAQPNRRTAQTVAVPKPASHSKPIIAAASAAPAPLPQAAPVAIAQVAHVASAAAVPALADAPPPPSDSLLAKTIDIKDHVLHATFHAVSMIGGIPNWIASIGDRIGGGSAELPQPSPRQFSTAS